MSDSKKDCFAYDEKNCKCKALDKMYCRLGETCKFYKTSKEYQEGIKKYGGLRCY